MLAIYKREVRTYFTNMIGYVFIAIMLAMIGVYMSVYNLVAGYPNFEYVLSAIAFIFLILTPILTMRSLSEERHQKIDQLLLSSPVPVSRIIAGKYLALLTVLAIPLLVSAVYPLILTMYGSVYLRVTYSVLLGFFLMGGVMMAIGLFMSSLTENQIIAAVLTFGVLLLSSLSSALQSMVTGSINMALYVFTGLILVVMLIVRALTKNWTVALSVAVVCEVALLALRFLAQGAVEGAIRSVLGALSISTRIDGLMSGVFDIPAIVYYLSVIGLFLFFSIQSVEKRRWS